MEFNFTLSYNLPSNTNIDDVIEHIGAVGCTDALIGIGQPKKITLEFNREAPNAESALSSALKDLKSAMPSAELIKVSPGYAYEIYTSII